MGKSYSEAPFVKILPSGTFPETKNVVGTNRIDFSAVYDPQTENIVITSVIDNLIKGQGTGCSNIQQKIRPPRNHGPSIILIKKAR